MKKIVLLSIALSGCAAIDAHNLSNFDANEYQLVNQINSVSQIAENECGSLPKTVQSVNYVFLRSTEFKNYASMIPHNEYTVTLAQSLYDITRGLHDRYNTKEPVSESYCKIKFNVIRSAATTIQQVLGSKSK
jgi:hypothetical protein